MWHLRAFQSEVSVVAPNKCLAYFTRYMEIDIADSINEIELMIFMKMLMIVDKNRVRVVPKNAVMASRVT